MDMFINKRQCFGHWKNWKKKKSFCYEISFSLKELKFSGNMYFSYLERLASAKVEKVLLLQRFFFNCYLAAPWPTLGHYWGGSLTHPMLIIAFLPIRPEDHWALQWGWVPKPGWAPSGVWTRNLPILFATP